MDYDPSYRDQNFLVAVSNDALLACVQIYPQRIRVLGHAIPTAGRRIASSVHLQRRSLASRG